VTDDETSRAILKKYVNRRVEVEGTISRIGTFWDSQARCNVPSVCLTNPEIRDADHPVVSNHVWVAYAQLMTNAGVEKGDTVRCSVQVYAYQQRDAADPNKTFTRYGFREPRELKCLNRDLSQGNGRAAAIATPAPAEVEDEAAEVVEEPPLPEPVKAAEPAKAPEPADPKRALFDTLYRLTEEYGIDKVEKVLSAVKALRDV
jgi:hypothetical protein